MKPKEIELLKRRMDNLDKNISNQISDFIPEKMDNHNTNKLYTSYIIIIFFEWLDKYVEDIKFK